MKFSRISAVASPTDPCKRIAAGKKRKKTLKKEQHNLTTLPKDVRRGKNLVQRGWSWGPQRIHIMQQPPMRLAPVLDGSLTKCQLSARWYIFLSFTEARMAIQDNIAISCVTVALANSNFLHFQMRTQIDVYMYLKCCISFQIW